MRTHERPDDRGRDPRPERRVPVADDPELGRPDRPGDIGTRDREVDQTRDVTYERTDERTDVIPDAHEAALRIPSFSLISPLAGWLTAWGAAALAGAALIEAGVGLGFGFGIADGSLDADAGFWAGLWTLVVQAGAFLLGGYVAGRMARARAIAHAVLAWLFAVLATAADAVVDAARDGGESVIAPLRLPHWAGHGYENTVAIPLAIFAIGALIGAVLGGLLAAGANRREVTTVPAGTVAGR